MSSTRRKLPLLAALYVSQAIPLGFFITAMPVILRTSGLSLESVGLFSAIALPWLIKFAWAPLIDRRPLGRRRYLSWIVPLQAAAVVCVALLAALDLGSQLTLVIAVAAVFMLLAATQDIASDGFAVSVLQPHERGAGNAMQVGGYYLGQVLGGGVVLMVFSRFGWSVALLAMAAFLALPLVPAARYPEPTTGATAAGRAVGWRDLGRFFRRPGAGGWIAVVLLFRAGEAMATYVFNQMLVDQGIALATIGVISGVVYAGGALTGALCAGALVHRLGRRRSLVGFVAVQGAATLSYALAVGGGPIVLGVAAFVVAAAGGLATTALYAGMMDASSERTGATDFTLQQSLAALGPLVGTALSGFSAARFGFAGHYLLCAALSFAVVALLLRAAPPRAPSPHRDLAPSHPTLSTSTGSSP